MKFKLLLMDMDSTLINEEGIDLLAHFADLGEEVASLTDAAMAGELDFYTSLRRRVALFEGQSIDLLDRVRDSLSLTEGAKDLISTLRQRGWRIGVVSGGFHEIIDSFLEPLELDFVRANRFLTRAGHLTGFVHEPIIGPIEKATALSEFAAKCEIPLSATVAIGDGANDREMLKRAGLGVAFCAKPALKEEADLILDQRDLRLLLNSI